MFEPEFKPYQDPYSVNYWQKKCLCKSDSFIYDHTILGSRIWTDETEEGPLCKNCLKAWKLVICYPEF